MTPKRVLLAACLASLVSSCAKEKAASESPGDAAASGGEPERGNLAADPAAQLAGYEAQLAARKAELASRGIAFAAEHDGDGAGLTTPGSTPPPADVVQAPSSEEVVQNAPTKPSRDHERVTKRAKAKKNKRTPRKSAVHKTPTADGAVDPCAPICSPADAICDLAARICGLAAEHEEETKYADACERAESDCERAADACEECRG